MATSFAPFAPWCLVALALVGCSMTAAPTTAASASPAASAMPVATATPVASATPKPSASPVAVQPTGGAAVLTPCQRDFMDRDKDGDGWITKAEYVASEQGKTFIQAPEAAFDQKDANKDGKLTPAEFGCEQASPQPGATPNGRG